MDDLIIDNKGYSLITRKRFDNKDYIVFEDDDSIYVSEYKIVANQIKLVETSLDEQKKVLESIGIDYGV